ncbi:MAG: hypothetical protein JNM72_17580 [Deltaproteobacteria bacterium]|nr:hypothetical protein [Deltaproteobacteria bacterium]
MRSPRLRPPLRPLLCLSIRPGQPAPPRVVRPWPVLCLGAALAAGCRTPSVAIEARSEMEVQVNGIGLSEDGSYGFAGMFQQACDFDSKSGSVGKDYDAGPGLELVLDVHAGRGLLWLDGGVGELRQSAGEELAGRPLDGQDVVHGRILNADDHLLVVEREGVCQLERHLGGAAPGRLDLPAEACDLSVGLVVDRADGVAFLGHGGGLLRVGARGAEPVDDTSSASLALDEDLGQLYAGSVGGGALRALDLQGGVRWSSALDGELVGVAALPAVDAALAAVNVDGVLRLLALHADDGAVVGITELDGVAATGLVSSADGRVAALVSTDRVRFFTIRAEAER